MRRQQKVDCCGIAVRSSRPLRECTAESACRLCRRCHTACDTHIAQIAQSIAMPCHAMKRRWAAPAQAVRPEIANKGSQHHRMFDAVRGWRVARACCICRRFVFAAATAFRCSASCTFASRLLSALLCFWTPLGPCTQSASALRIKHLPHQRRDWTTQGLSSCAGLARGVLQVL
jgi:hypothetical protein